MQQLTFRMRAAIKRGGNAFDDFVRDFMRAYYPDGAYPTWAVDALLEAGIELT